MCSVAELSSGKAIEKMILARRYAVVNDNGQIFGIDSECRHMRASLATGGISDGKLTCKWHGWTYSLETGECLNNPGFRLKRYNVEISDGDVYLLID